MARAAWIVGAASFGGGYVLAARGAKIDKLIAAGQAIDKADQAGMLTKAGRSLEKHGARSGSKFPKATGSKATKNAQGQEQLEEILKNKESKIKRYPDGTMDITHPDGRGVRYTSDGEFYGFRE